MPQPDLSSEFLEQAKIASDVPEEKIGGKVKEFDQPFEPTAENKELLGDKENYRILAMVANGFRSIDSLSRPEFERLEKIINELKVNPERRTALPGKTVVVNTAQLQQREQDGQKQWGLVTESADGAFTSFEDLKIPATGSEVIDTDGTTYPFSAEDMAYFTAAAKVTYQAAVEMLELKRGDVDGDGMVTDNDFNLLNQLGAENIAISSLKNPLAADINGDGKFDSVDITMINKLRDNPPSVEFQGIQDRQIISGTDVNFQIVANDDKGISKIEFYQDNILINTKIISPWNIWWNTTSTTNGEHELRVIAYDLISQKSENSIHVIVNN